MLVVMVLVGVVAGLVRPHRARFGAPRAVAVVFAAAAHASRVDSRRPGWCTTVLLWTSVLLGAAVARAAAPSLASVLLAIGAGAELRCRGGQRMGCRSTRTRWRAWAAETST